MKSSVTIIMPGLNEEDNLEASIDMVVDLVTQRFKDYEIIIFNDGSVDRTGEIADRIAQKNAHIQVVHNSGNKGIGYSFRKGVQMASKDYVGLLPADTNTAVSLEDAGKLLDGAGQADFILEYVTYDSRSFLRRNISRGYTLGMNLLFGLNAKYLNGSVFGRTELIKQVKMTSDSYSVFSETLIRLLKAGYSYVEVGIGNQDTEGNSRSLKLKTFVLVAQSALSLFWDLQIRPQWEALFSRSRHVETSTSSQMKNA